MVGAPGLGTRRRSADHRRIAGVEGLASGPGIQASRARRAHRAMTRRLPIIPTLLVAAAVAVMIGLGVWQLRRAGEKEQLIQRYGAAEKMPPISWPTGPLRADQLPLFRHATAACLRPLGKRATVGENQVGEPGFAQIVDCATANGPAM